MIHRARVGARLLALVLGASTVRRISLAALLAIGLLLITLEETTVEFLVAGQIAAGLRCDLRDSHASTPMFVQLNLYYCLLSNYLLANFGGSVSAVSKQGSKQATAVGPFLKKKRKPRYPRVTRVRLT